ncbi:helix-turn-helix domain-containing protein [Streptomyces bobili]|uniref:helix-turn-helix domain-containing protein n=1 Tax=Streptomyces bobili TaxID=67280 RepID=UPI003F4D343E
MRPTASGVLPWSSRKHGEPGLQDRPSVSRSSPTQMPPDVVERIEQLRLDNKWSARRITLELAGQGVQISECTVGRRLARLGINTAGSSPPTARPTAARRNGSSSAPPATCSTWTSRRSDGFPTAAGGGPTNAAPSRPGPTAREDTWRQERVPPALCPRRILPRGLHAAYPGDPG